MSFRLLGLLSVLVIGFTANSFAEEQPMPTINISGAYAYATTSVQKNGAVFLEVKNQTSEGMLVTQAATDVAERVELHTHDMDGDIMMMHEVEHYGVAPDETLVLEPMGHHIMLMGLKEPLKAGETFPLTLTIEPLGELAIEVTVKNPGDAMEDMH